MVLDKEIKKEEGAMSAEALIENQRNYIESLEKKNRDSYNILKTTRHKC